MSSAKIKNIILIVLVFLNAFFLAIIGVDTIKERTAHRRTVENLTTIMRNSGITVREDALHRRDAPLTQKTSRDAYAEATVARAALGNCELLETSGTSSSYGNNQGTATFNVRGEFTVEYDEPYELFTSATGYSRAIKKLLRKMGIEAVETYASAVDDYIVATCLYRGTPIYNCEISFFFENGKLVRITGRRPSSIVESPGEAERDLSTATLGLLKFVLDEKISLTEIHSITAGYRFNVGAFGAGELTPTWSFETDVGAFSLDALSGIVEHAKGE